MKLFTPPAAQPLAWSSDAVPPSIPLSTDAAGPHIWNWKLTWTTFSASGSVSTPGNTWDAVAAAAAGGGTLTVTAIAGVNSASAALSIIGTNPTPAQIAAFLATQPNGAGFNLILQHESGSRNFGNNGQPIVSFDHGYGICQLTDPAPSFLQVWNWKQNILGGLALFAQKRQDAIAYLSQGGRTYTPDELLRESLCAWNGGGPYFVPTANGWQRNPNILCDPKGGNAGWNMTDPANTGKSVAALHARDCAQYRGAPPPGAHWHRYGICYVDSLLG